MPPTALINAILYATSQRLAQGLVLIDGGKVTAVGYSHTIPLATDTRLYDGEGGGISVGLIEIVRGGTTNALPDKAAPEVTRTIVAQPQGFIERMIADRHLHLLDGDYPSQPTPNAWWMATLDQLRQTPHHPFSPHRLILCSDAPNTLNASHITALGTLPGFDFATAVAAATCNPARLLNLPQGCLHPTAPAHLIHWSRHHQLQHVIQQAPPATATQPDSAHALALRLVCRFLQNRPDTLALKLISSTTASTTGIDLHWRFRQPGGGDENARIWVCTTQPTAHDLSTSSSDWCFWVSDDKKQLICLPTRATSAWLHDSDREKRGFTFAALKYALPQVRRLRLRF